VKVAFQGQRGSYAEAAAAWMYADQDIATVPSSSAQSVVDAVLSGECQTGVIRLQNSDWGINNEVLAMLRSTRVYYVREIRFHERYNLAGQQGAHIENLKRIYAHPAILNMCSHHMARLADIEIIARYDSAESLASMVQRGSESEATVCSDFAAGIFGLKVLKASVENSEDAVTRFVALAAEKQLPAPGTSDVQTSVLIDLKHEPGALMNALTAFSHNGINLTAINSRPKGDSRFDYLTYIEFSGAFEDEPVRTALAALREHTTYMQLLGSYYNVKAMA